MADTPTFFPKSEICRTAIVTTFVSVGNATQPFDRLIEAVLEIVPRLPQPVVIQHGNTPLRKNGRYISKPFFEMEEFSSLVKQAEILILHAGAGSVIHAIQAGKIPVVMPRRAKYDELIDDHQFEFAHALDEVGKVSVAEEPSDIIEAVEKALKLQNKNRILNTEPTIVNMIDEMLREYAEGLDR